MYLSRFRRRYFALTALASLLFAVFLSACGGSGSGGGSSSNAPIEVGWIGPLSGVNAILGHWDTQGIELAIDAQNAKGGIHGRQIHLNKLDDAADPTQSVNDVQRLITQSHIVACFCTPNSGTTLAIEPLLTRNKIVQFTPGLAGNLTAKGSSYIFRDTPAGLAFESTLVTFLVQQKHFKSFAIITDTTDYGQGEAQYQTQSLQKFGLNPLTVQKYGANDTDFTGQLDTIIAAHPQVLLFGGSEVASGLIAKQARRLGFMGQLAGGAAIGTPKATEPKPTMGHNSCSRLSIPHIPISQVTQSRQQCTMFIVSSVCRVLSRTMLPAKAFTIPLSVLSRMDSSLHSLRSQRR